MLYLQGISLLAVLIVLIITIVNTYTKFDFLPPELITMPLFVAGIIGTGMSFYTQNIEQSVFIISSVLCFYIGFFWPYK